MKFVTVDDAQLRYEHLPRPGAPALMLMGALGTSLEMWDDQIAELSGRYELIRYDARGHGGSSSGSRPELGIERLAYDALAVLDACGVVRAHLCGLSMGGMVAMQIATLSPDRVLKIALCNTAPYMPPRENWEARIATVTSEGMAPIVEATLERWFTPQFRSAEPVRVERIRQMLHRTQPRGYVACCAAIRDMDQRETIRAITAKTLVLTGRHDVSTGPAQAELIARSVPDAKVVLLDAAHLSNVECAAPFNMLLTEFLAA